MAQFETGDGFINKGHEGPASISGCDVAVLEGPLGTATLPSSLPERSEVVIDDNVSCCELECPICYQMYCDPIRAACDRHVFCRNCLLRSQRGAATTKCPICRCESRADVCSLPSATDVLEKVQAKDTEYSEHLATAKREREEYLKRQASLALQLQRHELMQSGHYFDGWSTLRGVPLREVSAAGSTEINGIYVAGMLPTYVGPPLYRKLNTTLFIFRWRQTSWVIADLQSSRSMGDARDWLYQAPAQWPEEVPPLRGWEVTPQSRGGSPAPQVRIYDNTATESADAEATVLPESIQTSPRTMSTLQVRTRCRGVTQVKCCTVM